MAIKAILVDVMSAGTAGRWLQPMVALTGAYDSVAKCRADIRGQGWVIIQEFNTLDEALDECYRLCKVAKQQANEGVVR